VIALVLGRNAENLISAVPAHQMAMNITLVNTLADKHTPYPRVASGSESSCPAVYRVLSFGGRESLRRFVNIIPADYVSPLAGTKTRDGRGDTVPLSGVLKPLDLVHVILELEQVAPIALEPLALNDLSALAAVAVR
jgi:hypothetical protein